MVYLHRECFPPGSYHKLQPQKIGPCRILHKSSDNAYSVELPAGLHISNTFNVADLFTYHPPDATATSVV